ncbi:MAG: ComF family protein [Verrucomicrobiae bacterium]|nr:ComF family protein [Verrucomicrobiae bacterium]
MNSLLSRVETWLEAALSFLYPPVCALCGAARAHAASGLVCSGCRAQVRLVRPPFCERCGLPFEGALTTPFECANCAGVTLHFIRARSAAVAAGVVLEAIHRYKYQRALWLEPFLAGMLIEAAAPVLRAGGWDALVPVPLFPAKEREREFNQAERLARRLGAATGLPVRSHELRRVRATPTQTRFSREQRAANVSGAFAVRPGARFDGQRVVLVDDVFTTGATTSACAAALREAGAGEVCVWTVARGL